MAQIGNKLPEWIKKRIIQLKDEQGLSCKIISIRLNIHNSTVSRIYNNRIIK